MKLARALPDGQWIEAEIELVKLGKQSPYFSVTGSGWNNKAHAMRWPDNPHSCGAMHNDILRAWPDLADVVALHLSDIDGVPMHAEANGWYWYEKGEIATLRGHLRLPDDTVVPDMTRAEFGAYVDAQRDRWAREAKAAIDKYGLTVTTK